MSKILKVAKSGKPQKRKVVKKKGGLAGRFEGVDGPIDSQHLLISMLLPSAVQAFLREVESEVNTLCGDRYKHGKAIQRWGSQPGSIILGNQHVAIERSRVRNKTTGKEVKIEAYEQFQDPSLFEQEVFSEGLKKVSQRDYEKGLKKISSSFGFKKSNISKKWIKATSKKLDELQGRSLSEMDIRAVFLDGKRFSKYGVIIALGVASSGKKYVLGIYQASGEDHSSCLELLNNLQERGLASENLLFIVDGGSGLNKALNLKYYCNDPKKRKAIRIRCHIHKWRNIESALGDDAHHCYLAN